jgi:cytochrome b
MTPLDAIIVFAVLLLLSSSLVAGFMSRWVVA